MSVHFGGQDFPHTNTLPVFGIVNPVCFADSRGIGLAQTKRAGLIAKLRMSLAYARAQGCPIAFIRDVSGGEQARWLRGFEPLRSEMLFERPGPSCYSAPYLQEAVDAAGGTLVLAGMFLRGTLETAQAALRAGHGVVYLRDAICDPAACNMDEHVRVCARALTDGALQITTSELWRRQPLAHSKASRG